MRGLIVCNIVSLDGYYAGPGGDVMALPFDGGFDDYDAERLRAADTLLLGRTSSALGKVQASCSPAAPSRGATQRTLRAGLDEIHPHMLPAAFIMAALDA